MELVDKAIAKDNQAMETLYTTYYRDVLYVCKKLNLSDADANDIAQDAFIDAFAKLNTLNDKSKFKQWVCRIANNKALNLLKHNNVIKFENIDDDNSFTEIPDKEKSAETQVIENEVADILKNIIEKLPLEQKITVFMYYYEDMSVKEIANAYGISENTVRSRLNYAKKFISFEVNKLEDKGIKLRCTALLPFLYLLFAQEQEAFAAGIADSAIPSATSVIAKAVKNSVANSTSTAVSSKTAANTSSSTATATTASAVSTTAKVATTAAKTFSIGKIIGISSAVVAVIAAAIIGFTMLGNNDKKDKKDDDKKASWNDSLKENNEKDDSENDNSEDNNSEDTNLEDNENSNNNSEDSKDEEKEYETGDEYWNYYEIDSINLPEIKYNTIEYLQGAKGPISANIADTMFNFTPENITEKIKNSEYLKSKNKEYIFTTDIEEECHFETFSDVGLQKQYSVARIIQAFPKNHVDEVVSKGNYDTYDFDSDFRIFMQTDYTNYTTPNYIIFNVSNIQISREEQDKVFGYLTEILGEELAKYLVYSGDSRNIEENIKIGSTSYRLQRNLNFEKDEPNSDSLSFIIEVTHSAKSNNSYYTGDYVSAFNKELFSLDKFILGNFGSTNLDDLINFGSEYMKFGLDEEYSGTSAERLKYIIKNLPDGTVEERMFLDTQKGCSDVALLVCPEFDISLKHVKKNNETIDYSITFGGGLGLGGIPDDTEPDYTRLYEPLMGKLKSLLGDSVDLSPIDINAFNEEKGISFETVYFDKPGEGYISYGYGTNMGGLMAGEYEISISMK